MKIFAGNKIFFIKSIIPLFTLLSSFVLCSEKIPLVLDDKNAKEITSYVFKAANNPALDFDIAGTVKDSYIEMNLPYGTDITNLAPDIKIIGDTVSPSSGQAVDFSGGAVTYTVTAADLTKKDYSVILNMDSSTEKKILSFRFNKELNSDKVRYDYICTINPNNTISMIMPNPNDDEILEYRLKPTILFEGKSISPDNEEEVDFWFSNYGPVKYTVTAEDGSAVDYFVEIDHDNSSDSEISDFTFADVLSEDYQVDIQDDSEIHKNIYIDITVNDSYNTDNYDISTLIPDFDIPVNATIYPPINQPTNFSNPVNYLIIAEDTTYMAYTVYVRPKTEGNYFTDFRFLKTPVNAGLSTDVIGTINTSNNTISLTVPYGTNVSALKASFTTGTGGIVDIGGTQQVSGSTPNDFGSYKTYTVTPSPVGVSKNWKVTVTIAPNTACDITAFNIPMGSLNPKLTKDSEVQINQTNHTIAVTVEGVGIIQATDTFIATFSTTGKSVYVGSTPQVSGETPNIFNLTVVYRVNAEASGTFQDYTVTVTVKAASTTCSMTSFSIPVGEGPVVQITDTDATHGTIKVYVKYLGTNLNNLIATFSHNGYTVTVNSITQQSGVTSNNFSSPIVYRVTAQAPSYYRDYTVTAIIRETYVSLIPNGQGSETNIPAPGGCSCCWYWYYDRCGSPDSNHYIHVDDPAGSPDYDSTYVENNLGLACNKDERDLYQITNPSFSSSSQITRVIVRYIVKGTGVSNYWVRSWASIRTGNSTFDLEENGTYFEFTVKDTWYNRSITWTTNPLYGRVWYYDDIVNLQVGIKIGNHVDTLGYKSNIRCTQVYADVYYIPPLP